MYLTLHRTSDSKEVKGNVYVLERLLSYATRQINEVKVGNLPVTGLAGCM